MQTPACTSSSATRDLGLAPLDVCRIGQGGKKSLPGQTFADLDHLLGSKEMIPAVGGVAPALVNVEEGSMADGVHAEVPWGVISKSKTTCIPYSLDRLVV